MNELVCAWDVETDGLNGELLAVSWATPDSDPEIRGPEALEDFFTTLERYPSPFVWYAHNAQYDWRYILPELVKRYSCEFFTRSGTDIFAIKCTTDCGSVIDMRDSYAVWEGSLKSLLEAFAPNTPKLSLDFSKEVFDITNPRHADYSLRDAEGLQIAMTNYRTQFAELFECGLGFTSAGSAQKAWRKTLSEPFYCLSRNLEEQLREAYYGGVVFLTSNQLHENCKTFDINSSYPAGMITSGVPYGHPIRKTQLDFSRPGFWWVTVRAPENLPIPVLPARDDNGVTRWPLGTFETAVSSIELAFAIEVGYDIISVSHGIVFEKLVKPFDTFINKCRSIRLSPTATDAHKLTAKMMQNSLYGKFGTKVERREIIAANPDEQDCVGYELLEDLPLYCQWVDDEQTLRMVQWAAWITAEARVRLLRAAYAGGAEAVLYGDTDSLTVTEAFNVSALDVGAEYGQWKLEKVWKAFRPHAPKVYAGILENGDVVGRAKGMPRKIMGAEQYKKILHNLSFESVYDNVPSLFSIVRGKAKVGSGTERKLRTLTDLTNSRNWISDNGKIIARTMET